MHRTKIATKIMTALLAAAMSIVWSVGPALAQAAPPADQTQANTPPPSYSPEQLDRMVSRIALYPDPLLAQVLAAATFSDDIPDAAKWADDHHYLRGDQLAQAITADQLPWDPSVQALLPFPSVLDMMASDMDWTRSLGDAFLAQHDDVMNAVQRMRQKAEDYGYLRSNSEVVVSGGPYITIDPVDPAFVWVPAYDPAVVFFAPRPGFFVGGAIGWGFGINIGVWFRPWGWGFTHFDWGTHVVIVAGHPWGRVWANRFAYVHPWGPGVRRWPVANRAEGHRLIPRDQAERRAPREGHARPEERHHR
ncbi:MAG TPA: DUF3300 domain-containing protein [Candidatus Aquilonibacter sp.]|nr:DUF3300 domain-containing protein [Candidatus Aquilonibacter sp.]